MSYWLIKSEPSVYSIADLKRDKTTGWDGVRNAEARNNLKAMKKGDEAFFYHSNAEPSGIAGIVKVVREAYPDPTQFNKKDAHYDPRAADDKPVWFQVDIRLTRAFARVISLDELRKRPELADMALFKRSRLSVQAVTPGGWVAILRLAA